MKFTDCKYYLIDLDGVILDTSYDNYFWQEYIPRVYAKKNNISEKDGINYTHTLFRYKKKTKDWYDVDYWSNILDINIIQEKSRKENMSLIKIKEGAESALSKLKEDGKELFLVTNAHRKTLNVKLSKYDLSKYFNDLVCSHELGYVKEDIQLWHLLRNKLNIDYKKTVLVEDTFDNIQSAFHAGINNLIYISTEAYSFKKIVPYTLNSLSDLASST
tara:strand:- start:380 stop:1030 length:651 start_codon:yes stop_codon:yes gene_type:complete